MQLAAQLWLPSTQLQADCRYLERLGFRTAELTETHAMVTDGHYALRLGLDLAVPTLVFLSPELEQMAEMYAQMGISMRNSYNENGQLEQCSLGTFEGTKLVLCNTRQATDTRHVMDMSLPEYEICYRVANLAEAAAFWEARGFKSSWEHEGNGWGQWSNGVVNIGLYEEGTPPYPFQNPAITFYSLNNHARIADLQTEGFAFHQTFVDDAGTAHEAAAKTPSGSLIVFLFDRA